MSFTSPVRTRWSDLYVASGAQFFSSLATFLVMITLVLGLQRQGAGGLEVSLVVLSEVVPMVVLGKLIGTTVDRFDSRHLLVAAGVGQVIACVLLSTADSLGATLAGAVALSIASGVATPTRQALLPALVHRDDLARASAISQTAGSLGMMLGPALAGFMVSGFGPQQTVRIAAFGFLGTIIAGLAIQTRRGGRVENSSDEDGAATSWTLASDRLLWSAVWSTAAVVAAIAAVNVTIVFFIIRTLNGTEATYGLVDATWTIGVLLGAWLFSRVVRSGTGDTTVGRWLVLALGLIAVATVFVGLVSQAWWIVPCYLIGGANNGGINVLLGTLVGRRTPPPARGRANAALAMRVQGGAMIGFLGGGLLLEFASPRAIVLGCGILGLATAAGAAWFMRQPTRAMLATTPSH